MTIKRAPPHVVFNTEARNRVGHVLTLLFTVSQRNAKSNRTSTIEKKSKTKEERKLTYDQLIGPWQHGPLLRSGTSKSRPCFFVKLLYH